MDMPKSREHQQFHVGLKAFIANGNKLLILQDTEGLWELPGGRTEKTELQKPLPEILLRETTEELGVELKYEIGSIFHAWIRKPDRDNDFCIFLVGFQCSYRAGQVTLSAEHQAHRWVTKEEAESLEFENTYKEAVQTYFENYPR
jgi:8-oxo-dGTP pyrophosphatase MutT (NUDIX family)